MLHSPVSPTIPSRRARRRQGARQRQLGYATIIRARQPILATCADLRVTYPTTTMTAPDNARAAGAQAVLPAAAAWTLTVLTVLNFFNYVDRYVLAAVLTPLHRDPAFVHVSDADLGRLQLVFLGVYMIVSPIGGALGDRVARKYIVAGGVAIWSVATLWSGAARS